MKWCALASWISPVASHVRVTNVITMSTVHVELPAELLALAGDADLQPSRAAAQLIALELFRENRVSLGKAAELAACGKRGLAVFC